MGTLTVSVEFTVLSKILCTCKYTGLLKGLRQAQKLEKVYSCQCSSFYFFNKIILTADLEKLYLKIL